MHITQEQKQVRTPEEQKQYLIDLMFTKHLSVTWRVFLITGGSVAVLGFVGHLIDRMLGTERLFVFAGVMFAFLVAQVLNFIVFTRLVHATTSPSKK